MAVSNAGAHRRRETIVCATLILAFCGFGQTFEAASVKANTTGERPREDSRGSQLAMYNIPMFVLVARAYGVANDKVVGPAWLQTDGYDIVAKLPPDTTRESLWVMLRNLLAERFKLEVHREEKVLPVYALVVTKGGPKLPAAAGDSQERSSCSMNGMQITCKCQKTTMANLVQQFPRWMPMNWFDLPVVDQTGLSSAYDFSLTWTAMRTIDQTMDAPGISFFDALQDQLGLKLEQRKAPVERVVVDHAERVPVAN